MRIVAGNWIPANETCHMEAGFMAKPIRFQNCLSAPLRQEIFRAKNMRGHRWWCEGQREEGAGGVGAGAAGSQGAERVGDGKAWVCDDN
jgi:hypothetical protein